MKNVFVAANKGEFLLDEAGRKLMSEGLEILESMVETAPEGELPWWEGHAEEIDAWIDKTRHLSIDTFHETSPAPGEVHPAGPAPGSAPPR